MRVQVHCVACMYGYVCTEAYLCLYIWRSEVKPRCYFSGPVPLLLGTKLTGLELDEQSRVAPRTACLCTPSPVWDYKCGPPYYVFCMNSRGEIQVPMLAQPALSRPNSSLSSAFKR